MTDAKRDWQRVQGHLGLVQDGIPGANTARALLKALGLDDQKPPPRPAAGGDMPNDAVFFRGVRRVTRNLEQDQVDIINAVLAETTHWPNSWVAYLLATAWHETGGKLVPNRENLNYSVQGLLKTFGRHRISTTQARRLGRTKARKADQVAIGNQLYGGDWGRENLGNTETGDGYKYRGGGMDHTTGRANFQKADKALGMDGKLMANPDLITRPEIAVKVMVNGMETGWYTGVSLADALPSPRASENQFYRARPIINRMDKARKIAGYALGFQAALEQGGRT